MREHVSISEIREFQACPLRWWYRYENGLWTEKTSSFFALGTAVHAGLANWYEPLNGGKKDGDLTMPLRLYKATFADESAKVNWADESDKDPISQSALGEDMLKAAIFEGDDWTAKAVERTFMADIQHSRLGKLPIKLKSVLDMVTTTNDVVEHKTATRKWDEGREHGDIQATAYVRTTITTRRSRSTSSASTPRAQMWTDAPRPERKTTSTGCTSRSARCSMPRRRARFIQTQPRSHMRRVSSGSCVTNGNLIRSHSRKRHVGCLRCCHPSASQR